MMERFTVRFVLLAGVFAGLSCGDATRPTPALEAGLGGPVIHLLQCTPLTADSVSQAIGPAGGTLMVGPHTLEVPAGALDSTVTITAVAPSDTINRVRFGPEGLAFAVPARLSMSYANCASLPLPKRVAYVDVNLDILQVLLSFDLWWTGRVKTYLDHFSNYAVAW